MQVPLATWLAGVVKCFIQNQTVEIYDIVLWRPLQSYWSETVTYCELAKYRDPGLIIIIATRSKQSIPTVFFARIVRIYMGTKRS